MEAQAQCRCKEQLFYVVLGALFFQDNECSKILKLKLCLWSFTETSPSHKKSALVFRFTKKQPFEISHIILHVVKPFGQILAVNHLAVLKLLFLKVLMLLPNKLYGL